MTNDLTTDFSDVPKGRRRGNDLTALSEAEARPLAGRRVLVAEDNIILSMHLALMLEQAGAEVEGPYPYAREALGALDGRRVDAAILDHELMGGTSAPVASRLGELGVPFAYFTSHSREDVEGVGDAVMIEKPAEADALLAAVTSLL